MLCGHCRDISYKNVQLDDDGDGNPDRTVYAILSNFQGSKAGGGGYMRILDFRDSDIYIYTYSPITIPANTPRAKPRLPCPCPDCGIWRNRV